MNKQIVILGAGIVGRFAKVLIPEAELFERKSEGDIGYTCNYLMGNLSRINVPELDCKKMLFRTLINGEIPNTELIQNYKESKVGNRKLEYGDYKQFIHEQIVYSVELPKVPINFGKEVLNINPIEKKIIFKDGSHIEYGCIINTIPLKNLIALIDFWKHYKIDRFFVSKPIFYKEYVTYEAFPEDIIVSNYIVSEKTPLYRITTTKHARSEESYYEIKDSIKILPGKIIFSDQAESVANDLHLYGIYSYGRYGRWRATEHIHETFKNLRRFAERQGEVGYC
jgi:hypothetical protein